MTTRTEMPLERVAQRELRLCQRFHRGCRYACLKRSFSYVTWPGDGKFWYALIAVVSLVHDRAGLAGDSSHPVSRFIASGTGLTLPHCIGATIGLLPAVSFLSI